MVKKWKILLLLLALSTMLTGCNMPTVDQLYCLPKRYSADSNLQEVIDEAMEDLQYCAPIAGNNQQTVQSADLDGDGKDEYLLFAKDNSEKPLKILIFSEIALGYVLMDTIEGYGFGFEFVEYANVDDRPGLDIIVGRQVGEQVVRSIGVYRFTSGFSRQLMSSSYSRVITADFDGCGSPGDAAANGHSNADAPQLLSVPPGYRCGRVSGAACSAATGGSEGSRASILHRLVQSGCSRGAGTEAQHLSSF